MLEIIISVGLIVAKGLAVCLMLVACTALCVVESRKLSEEA